MGRAVLCPLCRSHKVSLHEVRYQTDLWSRFPSLTVEAMLAMVCENCRNVRLVHPLPFEPDCQSAGRN